ncbi:MAG: phosphoserine phosphatase SerB [Leptospira sp.]|nr:phosphoserine phosphatase SerB [Leptospira sp.]
MFLLFLSPENSPDLFHSILSGFDIKFQDYSKKSDFGIYGFYYRIYESIPREKVILIREKAAASKSDFLFLDHLLDREKASLFVFDMDSTLIKEEVIDELARANGVYEQVANVTREAMEGNLDFNTALRKRVNYLSGLPENSFEELYSQICLNDGVTEVLKSLSEKGIKTAVFSGGFLPVVSRFAKDHKINFFEANTLEVKNGRITGIILSEIVNKEKKKQLLVKYRDSEEISPLQTVAVGDGANDFLMIGEAGIGIGVHAKEGLKSRILNWIDFSPMTALLFFFDPE